MPVRPPQPDSNPIDALSERQRDVLELAAKGLTNEDIARVLGITRATARTHIAAILRALDVTNRTEAASFFMSWNAAPPQVASVLERPAIAVLPPLALDGDATARTMAAGLGHDLSALFARWCWFPVIAQSSIACARVPASGCREIGRALGARFLIDGSLRRGSGGWRLVLELSDTEVGASIWADTYAFPSDGLFEVQDAVCAAVVATCYPLIAERALAGAGHVAIRNDLAAWEHAHDGMRLQSKRDAASVAAAQERFSAGLARDETLALAHFGRGLCAYDEILNQWGDPGAAADQLAQAAERCVALAPHGAEGHYLLGRYHQTHGDHASAVRELEIGVAKNPSFAVAHALLAQALQLTGRSEEALERMRHALRLGPRSFVAGLATLHFARREYAAAVEAAEGAIAINPRYTYARALAAAAAYWHGDQQRANAHMQALQKGYPTFRATSFLQTFGSDVEAVSGIVGALKLLGAR